MKLDTPNEEWLRNAIRFSGLEDLYYNEYSLIDNNFLSFFSKRWHEETSYFCLPIRQMTLTIYDMSCLLHLHIEGLLLLQH